MSDKDFISQNGHISRAETLVDAVLERFLFYNGQRQLSERDLHHTVPLSSHPASWARDTGSCCWLLLLD